MHTPPSLGFALTRVVDLLLRDMVLTRGEVDGLMAGLLMSSDAPTGAMRLSDRPTDNANALGRRYVSKLRRNYRRKMADSVFPTRNRLSTAFQFHHPGVPEFLVLIG